MKAEKDRTIIHDDRGYEVQLHWQPGSTGRELAAALVSFNDDWLVSVEREDDNPDASLKSGGWQIFIASGLLKGDFETCMQVLTMYVPEASDIAHEALMREASRL